VLKHWPFLSVYLSVKLLAPVRGRCWISGMHTLPFFVLTSPLPLLFVAGCCCFPSEFHFLLKLIMRETKILFAIILQKQILKNSSARSSKVIENFSILSKEGRREANRLWCSQILFVLQILH
jgi:hypothetical protein